MGDADFDQEQHDEAQAAAARLKPMSQDHLLLDHLGTDARAWAKGVLDVIKVNIECRFKREVDMDVDFELESILTTWFANAIEMGRDVGSAGVDQDVDEDGPSDGINETVGERAIRCLEACAEALDAMPYGLRTSALGGVFGNIPLNRTDHLRQEAQDILHRLDAAAAATREV